MVKSFTGLGGITYTAKNESDVKFKKLSNGTIQIIGHNANVFLPKNEASKIQVSLSNNLIIEDGEETIINGKKFADEITIDQTSSSISYTAARKVSKDGKPIWSEDAIGGDKIKVFGSWNKIFARSGNNVIIDKFAEHNKVEAYDGCEIQDKGTLTHNEITRKTYKTQEQIKAERDKETQKYEQEKLERLKKTVSADLMLGVLTRKKGTFDNVEYFIFDADKYGEKNKGKKLNYGDIKSRYGLSDGVLKKENGLRFLPHDMDKRGDDINLYYPGEIGSKTVKFRVSELQKSGVVE